MSEAIWKSLCAALDVGGKGVLASVVSSRGATPRKPGAMMWIEAEYTVGSVGGGAAEAHVLTEARAMLGDERAAACLEIPLQGGDAGFGVCGGHMQVALRRWRGDADAVLARQVLATMQCAGQIDLSAQCLGASGAMLTLHANPRLLIVGGGHCGLALARHAISLDFDVWAYDARDQWWQAMPDTCTALHGDWSRIREALQTPRPVYAVLLNRDYVSDVQSLEQLAHSPPDFIGMMGSARRIHEVRRALSSTGLASLPIHAPVGLDIHAETPDEIAISVLAQLVRFRHASRCPRQSDMQIDEDLSVDDPKSSAYNARLPAVGP